MHDVVDTDERGYVLYRCIQMSKGVGGMNVRS